MRLQTLELQGQTLRTTH